MRGGGGEVLCDLFGGFDERLLAGVGDGDDHVEGCDGGGEDVGFSAKFCGGGFDAAVRMRSTPMP